MFRVKKTQYCCYREKGLSHFIFEESFAPILLDDVLRQLKLHHTYKRNLKVEQKNVHRPNSRKSTYTFHCSYSKNIGNMQGSQIKTTQSKLRYLMNM